MVFVLGCTDGGFIAMGLLIVCAGIGIIKGWLTV